MKHACQLRSIANSEVGVSAFAVWCGVLAPVGRLRFHAGVSGPDRRSLLAALLLGAGVAVTLVVGRAYLATPETHAQGSGDPGFVAVYAQLPAGPVRLEVGVPRLVPRPQDIAFQWSAEGTGPRLIRIELMAEAGSVLLSHEERVMAPMTLDSLGWVLHLGDEYPDQLVLVVTISAPHTGPRILKYPFQLGPHSS